jgi:hypothetical protein
VSTLRTNPNTDIAALEKYISPAGDSVIASGGPIIVSVAGRSTPGGPPPANVVTTPVASISFWIRPPLLRSPK